MSIAPLFTSPPPSPTNLVTGLGNTFPPKSITTVAQALSSSAGIASNSSLTAALQPQTAADPLTATNSNSSLAAAINPGVNLQVSAQLQVTDFVNPTSSAFPTSAPAAPAPSAAPPPPDASATQDNSPGTQNAATPAATNTDNFSLGASNPAPAPVVGESAGIYTAVASANTSTIRGSGVDVSA